MAESTRDAMLLFHKQIALAAFSLSHREHQAALEGRQFCVDDVGEVVAKLLDLELCREAIEIALLVRGEILKADTEVKQAYLASNLAIERARGDGDGK